MDFTGELEMEEDPIRRRTMQQEFEKVRDGCICVVCWC